MSSVVHSSFVLMNGKLGMIKQRRFLVLDEAIRAICICRNEQAVSDRRTLPLEGLESVSVHGTKFILKYSAKASPPNNGRSFTFLCRKEEDAADWVAAIQSLLMENSTSKDSTRRKSSRSSRRKSKSRSRSRSRSRSNTRRESSHVFSIHEASDEDMRPKSRPVSTISGKSLSSHSGKAPAFVADLEYFEFLGGIVESQESLLWIGEKPPVKSAAARQLGSSIFVNRVSKSRKKTSSMSSTSSKKLLEEEVEEPQDVFEDGPLIQPEPSPKLAFPKPKQRPVTMRIPAGFDKVIEQNMADKSKGKVSNVKALKALPIPDPKPSPGKSSRGKGFRLLKKSSKNETEKYSDNEAEPSSPPKTKEEIKEKIARQARLAGGGEYMTGAATVGLGEEIQKSKLAQTLAQRKVDLEKKKEQEKKAASAKPKQQTKEKQTLDSFLSQSKGEDEKTASSSSSKLQTPGNKLQAFLQASSNSTNS